MAILLFKLNGVPEDEADDIRVLLDKNDIDYYETEQGNWGISLAGIWLRNEMQREQAISLIDTYQRERFLRAREEFEARRKAGEVETLIGRAIQHPLKFLIYLLAIGAILYLSIVPFIKLAE